MGRKLVSMLLVLAIGIALLPGVTVLTRAEDGTTDAVPEGAMTMSAWADGGYSEDVTELTINDEDDFKAFQIAMCTYGQTFEGYEIYLTADLDLNPDWNSPIYLEWENGKLTGNYDQLHSMNDVGTDYYLPAEATGIEKVFNGVFDGKGHILSGLMTYAGGMNSTMAASLFGKTTGENTVVKNLAVLDSAFVNGKTNDPATGFGTVKPIAGLFTIVASGASATISNCYIDIDLYDAQTTTAAADSKVGGLVGYCQGSVTIENCVYAGSISNNTAATCTVNGTSTATAAKRRLGAAIGRVEGTSSAQAIVDMDNFVFTGKIYNQDPGASGCIGYCAYGDVDLTNCLSLGELYGSDYVAGFIAVLSLEKTENVTLTDCYTAAYTASHSGTAILVGNTKNIVGQCTLTQVQNGSSYIQSYDVSNKTKNQNQGEAGDYSVKDTNEDTLAISIGGEGTKTLASVYTNLDGAIVPTALKETFGEDTHMLLGESMSVWATSGYADLTTKVLRIKTPTDFQKFQTAMCTDGQTFDGYTIYLTNDIDMNPDWSSPVNLKLNDEGGLASDAIQGFYDPQNTEETIDTTTTVLPSSIATAVPAYALPVINTTSNATSAKTFGGTFEGMGHSISGLYLTLNSATALALFGQVTGNAAVRDLAVLDSYIGSSYLNTGSSSTYPIGGLFSVINTGATVEISNCYVDVDLYDGKAPAGSATAGKVGGLVGYCEGTLTITDSVYAGSASINHIATGTTYGKRHLAGAVGYVKGTAKDSSAIVTMENFIFAGMLYHQFQRVSGGIARSEGYTNITMKNCLNLGEEYGSSNVGEFIASILLDNSVQQVTLIDCYRNSTTAMANQAGTKGNYGIGTTITVTKNGSSYIRTTTDASTLKQTSEDGAGNYNLPTTNEKILEMSIGGEGGTLASVYTEIGATIIPKNLYQTIAPEITAKSRTISLEGNIWINRYVNFSGLTGINLESNAGLLIWSAPIAEEDAIYGAEDTAGNGPTNQIGLVWDSEKGAYGQSTDGIAAPHYGDKLYMRAYVKVGDAYIYGGFTEYSVADYCTNKISNSDDESLKALCAAVLNYGAAAQTRFNYDTENLVNADLDSTLTTPYDSDMLIALNSDFTTTIEADAGTIVDKATRSISLDEGIRINYYFYLLESVQTSTIATAELLTWSGVEDALTYENATKTDLMWLDNRNAYAASGALVAAKDCGDTIYACARFVDTDGKVYYTAVTGYSAHQYAASMLEKETTSEATQNVLEALIVYSNLAKTHFAE